MRREAVAGAKGGEGSPIRRKVKGRRFEGMRRVAGNAKSRRRFGVGIGKAKGRRECEESSAIWSGRRRVTGNAKSRRRLGVGIGKAKGRRECEESSAIWSGYREGEGSSGMCRVVDLGFGYRCEGESVDLGFEGKNELSKIYIYRKSIVTTWVSSLFLAFSNESEFVANTYF